MHSVFIRKHVAYDCHPGIRFSPNRIKLPTSWQTGEAWREHMLSQDEWFTAVCESYLNPPVVVDGKELPVSPIGYNTGEYDWGVWR